MQKSGFRGKGKLSTPSRVRDPSGILRKTLAWRSAKLVDFSQNQAPSESSLFRWMLPIAGRNRHFFCHVSVGFIKGDQTIPALVSLSLKSIEEKIGKHTIFKIVLFDACLISPAMS